MESGAGQEAHRMMAVYVVLFAAVIVLIWLVGLFVFSAGMYCDCPKCVKWRAERKAEGEKRDGASDSNF